MQLIPWRRREPRGVVPFRREFDDFWDRFFGETSLPGFAAGEWVPDLDISETDGQIKVTAEIPGMEAKDIDVDVSGDILTIRGEKKREEEKEDEQYRCQERYVGAFQRSVRLPDPVKPEDVDATFKNGVLKINLAKSEEAGKKKIEVKSE
jgi:HSP20 family protein